jgi:hypothetical protein
MKGLDNYLTNPPDDGFEDYHERVIDNFTDEFYRVNEDWIIDSDLCLKWVNKCFYKGTHEPKYCAKLIQRTFNLYRING